MRGFVLAVLFLAAPAASQVWVQSPINGHFYARTPNGGTWHEQEALAQSWGGHLATIRSQAEQDWLWSTFGPRGFWIGLTDENQELNWEWSSGEPVPYLNWGKAPRYSTNTNWVFMDMQFSGKWIATACCADYDAVVEVIGPVILASYSTFGVGCGPGVLNGAPGSFPRFNEQFDLDITNLSQFQAGVLFTGVSNQWLGSTPLPIPLDSIAMPGCSLYVTAEAQTAFTTGFGRSYTWSVTIPPIATFAGMSFYQQAFILNPSANPRGLEATNAGQGTVGS